jgi:hypothetical protein
MLFRLNLSAEPLRVGQTSNAVGLRVLDARGVALHADTKTLAQIERLLVGQAELPCELVHPDPLACHLHLSNGNARSPRLTP